MHDYLKPTYQKCKPNPSQEQTGTFLPKTRLSLNYESKKVKYHFRVENTEFRIPNYRYTGYRFFFQSIVLIVKHCTFYIRLKLSRLRSMLSFYTPWKASENHRILMFSGSIKGNIDPKWVNQLQYWRGRHNFMLLACTLVIQSQRRMVLRVKQLH